MQVTETDKQCIKNRKKKINKFFFFCFQIKARWSATRNQFQNVLVLKLVTNMCYVNIEVP